MFLCLFFSFVVFLCDISTLVLFMAWPIMSKTIQFLVSFEMLHLIMKHFVNLGTKNSLVEVLSVVVRHVSNSNPVSSYNFFWSPGMYSFAFHFALIYCCFCRYRDLDYDEMHIVAGALFTNYTPSANIQKIPVADFYDHKQYDVTSNCEYFIAKIKVQRQIVIFLKAIF